MNDCGKNVNADQPSLQKPHDKINFEHAEGFVRTITIAGAEGGKPVATYVSAPIAGSVQTTPESSTLAQAVTIVDTIIYASMRARL